MMLVAEDGSSGIWMHFLPVWGVYFLIGVLAALFKNSYP